MLEKIEDYFLSFLGICYSDCILNRNFYKSKKWVKRYQYKKMKKLLKICETDIPYYRNMFSQIGFDVDRDFKSLDDIKKIPITTKDNVRNNKELFVNPKYRSRSLVCKTSGSTGHPLEVLVSKNQWVMEQAVVWMQWKWAGYKFRSPMAIVRSYTPKNGKLIKAEKIRNFIYYSPYNMTDANMDMYLNDMIRRKIKFLRGYPSSIATLAGFVKRTGHEVPDIKAVFVASEVLIDGDRELIEEEFKTKVFNYYGMAECVVAMGDCEQHKGLHIYEPYGYVEFLESNNKSEKKIIGTNLNNYAMPLLRYETNDLAIMADASCKCGRTFSIVKNIVGRSNSLIKLKDREIPLTNFYTLMEHYPQVGAWQIVQHSKTSIELILEKEVTPEIRNELNDELGFRLPQEVQIQISERKDFVRKGEGKKLGFVSMI